MKKFLYIFICLVTQILFCNSVSCEPIEPIPFKNSQFYLYDFAHKKDNYDLINYFFADDLELKGTSNRAALTLFCSKLQIPKPEIDSLGAEYAKNYTVGTIVENQNGFAISFVGENNGKIIYSIIKFKDNDVEGTDVAQIYIPILSDSKSQSQFIKTLDNKYFKYFTSYNFPPIKDEHGNEVPKNFKVSFQGEPYILKFSRKSGTNYYAKENRNLVNYDTIIRVNYNVKHRPDKISKIILDDSKDQTGFEILRNEKIQNAVIVSYVTDMINLSTQKEFKSLSVYKIEPHKGSARTMEISTRIAADKPNIQKKIADAEKKYFKYLLDSSIFPLIRTDLGMLPNFVEEEFFQYNHGAK